MLINVADEEESRVAIVEDGILEELTIETSEQGANQRQYLQWCRRQS